MKTIDNNPIEIFSQRDFPKDCMNNITVDTLIFAMHESTLKVLLVKHSKGLSANKWGLVGHWVKQKESLDSAARRIVKSATGVENLYLEQFESFGQLHRYPQSRIITIAYYSLIRFQEAKLVDNENLYDVQWFDIYNLPKLIFDHQEILTSCLQKIQYKIRREPIGFSLLSEKFTLLQLQEIYESVLNTKLDKPNFRRKIKKMNLLIHCQEKQQNVSHRAASLFRFDINVYEKIKEFGFNFEF